MMPKLNFLLLLCAFIGACSRDPNSATSTPPSPTSGPAPAPSPDTSGYIKYKVNGNLVTIKNTDAANSDHILCTKQTRLNAYTPTMYLLSGVKDSSNGFGIGIVSDSLLVGNYNLKDGSTLTIYNGQLSELGGIGSGDSLNVNITSYSKGLISGNFSGQFSLVPNPAPAGPIDWSSLPKTAITEGEFKNIKCLYH